MAAADVWGSAGGPLANGVVKINGVNVVWNTHVKMPGGPNHAWGDVTSIVKPVVDATPAGIVNFNILETIYLDGSILAVIFDDPNQTVSNTVILLFGTQAMGGDTFNIALANPLDKSDPNLALDLSLGIAFGYQPGGQVSHVSVNGQRMTSSAGGQDDGYAGNGGLITAGGIGDSNANPPPYAPATSVRTDDELYSLLPFVNTGDTSIVLDTYNPSYNDSIFFAGLFVGSATAIIGEGIILGPASATNEVGTQHTVTATLQDDDGNPVGGRAVTFTITAGPHAGNTSTTATDANGQATDTYTGASAGTDSIEASFVDSQGKTQTSNQVTKEWTAPANAPPVAVSDSYSVDEDNTLTVAAPGVLSNDTDADGNPLTAVKDSDPANGSLTLNSDGSFTYTPNANYYGADSFTYHANDGTADSDVATVSIIVNSVNDPPVALDDSASTDEDTAVTIPVLDNDSDIDGGALVVAGVTQPATGSAANNGGSVTYNPNGQFETLAAGQTATETFGYTVSDGLGGSDTATVTVMIDGVNDAPVADVIAIADATIPLPVTMKVTPQTLNLSRLGNWVKVHITDDTENTPQVMEVTLDGSGSYDIDDGDEIVSWDWTLVGPEGEVTVADVEVTTVSLPAGDYIITLITLVVNDGDADSVAVSETFTLTNQTIDDLAAGSYTLNGVPDSEVKGPDNGSVVISFDDDAIAATVEVGPDREVLLAGTASGVDFIDVIEGGEDGSKGKSGPKF